MKRLTLLLVGLAAVAGCFRAGAQIPAEPFGVYKADIGTLLRFMRSEITPAVGPRVPGTIPAESLR